MKTFRQLLEDIQDQQVDKVIRWVKKGDNRASMTAIAKSSIGGPVHPGKVTVYRGVHDDSVDAKKVGASWTTDKKVAQKYAGEDGKVVSTKIDDKTPAFDLSKFLPKKLAKDKEVFVAKLGE